MHSPASGPDAAADSVTVSGSSAVGDSVAGVGDSVFAGVHAARSSIPATMKPRNLIFMHPLLCYFSQLLFKSLIVISDIHYICLSDLLMEIDNPRLK
jgi:hypothetical protein